MVPLPQSLYLSQVIYFGLCFWGIQPEPMRNFLNSRIVLVIELGVASGGVRPALQVWAENVHSSACVPSCWAPWLSGSWTGRTGETLLMRFSLLTWNPLHVSSVAPSAALPTSEFLCAAFINTSMRFCHTVRGGSLLVSGRPQAGLAQPWCYVARHRKWTHHPVQGHYAKQKREKWKLDSLSRWLLTVFWRPVGSQLHEHTQPASSLSQLFSTHSSAVWIPCVCFIRCQIPRPPGTRMLQLHPLPQGLQWWRLHII